MFYPYSDNSFIVISLVKLIKINSKVKRYKLKHGEIINKDNGKKYHYCIVQFMT